jgi:hypothetical protein
MFDIPSSKKKDIRITRKAVETYIRSHLSAEMNKSLEEDGALSKLRKAV